MNIGDFVHNLTPGTPTHVSNPLSAAPSQIGLQATSLDASQAQAAAAAQQVALPTVKQMTISTPSPPVSTHATKPTTTTEIIDQINKAHAKGGEDIDTEKANIKEWTVSALKTSKTFNFFLALLGIALTFTASALCILCPPMGVGVIVGAVIGLTLLPAAGGAIFGFAAGNILNELFTSAPAERQSHIEKSKQEIERLNNKLEPLTESLKLLKFCPNKGKGDSYEEFLAKFSGDGTYKFNLDNLAEINKLFIEGLEIAPLEKEMVELQEERLEYEMLIEGRNEFDKMANDGTPLRTLAQVMDRIHDLPTIQQARAFGDQILDLTNQILVPKENANIAELTAEKERLEKIKPRKDAILQKMDNHVKDMHQSQETVVRADKELAEIETINKDDPNYITSKNQATDRKNNALATSARLVSDLTQFHKTKAEELNKKIAEKQKGLKTVTDSFKDKFTKLQSEISASDKKRAEEDAKKAAEAAKKKGLPAAKPAPASSKPVPGAGPLPAGPAPAIPVKPSAPEPSLPEPPLPSAPPLDT